MKNFDYQTPTRLIFGRDVVAGLPEVIRPFGRRILLTYGGGSIKRIGLYDRVKELLKDFEIFELGGIEPNPKYSTSVVEGVRICKEQQIDVILSVGGGSVLDCSKAIAGGAKYDGETWDLIIGKAPTLAALPIVDILTLAATGSEYDAGGVISRTETNDKVAYIDPHLFPACSFLDPTYTFTVNAKHTAAGVADAINHVMEQYFTHASNSVADGFCETLVKTLMKYAPIALEKPDWPMHGIEHALSGYYDITHGEGLAIITPHWMRHVLNERTQERIVKFGVNVFGLAADQAPSEIAEQTIARTAQFFKSLGMPMTVREVGIDDSRLEEMAHHIAVNEGLDAPGTFAPLNEQDILSILKAAL